MPPSELVLRLWWFGGAGKATSGRPRRIAVIPAALPMWEAMWSATTLPTGRPCRVKYNNVEYVFSAYCSRLSIVGYGRPSMYFSLSLIIRMNHVLLIFAFPCVRASRSASACARRMETGCFWGRRAKAELMLSRQNWRRMERIMLVDAMSAIREVSMLNARRAR